MRTKYSFVIICEGNLYPLCFQDCLRTPPDASGSFLVWPSVAYVS